MKASLSKQEIDSLRANTPSGLRGLHWLKYSQKWVAYINVNKRSLAFSEKSIILGSYLDIEDAMRARIEAERIVLNAKCHASSMVKLRKKFNSITFSDNKSGVNGLSWDRGRLRWRACANTDGKQVHVGNFRCFHEAKQAMLDYEVSNAV